MRTISLVVLTCSFLVALTVGCPGPSGDLPDLVPVTGTVTLDGEPSSGVTVVFYPTGSTIGGFCYGSTDESGRYELQAKGERKGAQVGEFKVTCSKLVMPDGSPLPAGGEGGPPIEGVATETLPAKYVNEATTELKATVPSGGGTVDLALTSGE